MAAPEPGPGDVRVRVGLSGVNPGDTKRRQGWLGFGMPYPRIIPHSDGAGVIDAVGEGVEPSRIGQCVWVYGAQSYRAFGTAVAATEGVIAAYATRSDRPSFPFWPMLFANLTIRLLGSDDFPRAARRQAAADLTTAAGEGALSIPIGEALPLDQIAEAQDRVDGGVRERVLLAIP